MIHRSPENMNLKTYECQYFKFLFLGLLLTERCKQFLLSIQIETKDQIVNVKAEMLWYFILIY